MTWVSFSSLFMEKYIPRTLRDRKRDEFLSLEQGRMSVNAFEAKFRALSRYATQFCFSPQERIRHYVKGLRSELWISALQVAATAKSMQEMVDFDVILGMTWLSPNFAILDCNAKTVTLAKPGTNPLFGRATTLPLRFVSSPFFVLREWLVRGVELSWHISGMTLPRYLRLSRFQ